MATRSTRSKGGEVEASRSSRRLSAQTQSPSGGRLSSNSPANTARNMLPRKEPVATRKRSLTNPKAEESNKAVTPLAGKREFIIRTRSGSSTTPPTAVASGKERTKRSTRSSLGSTPESTEQSKRRGSSRKETTASVSNEEQVKGNDDEDAAAADKKVVIKISTKKVNEPVIINTSCDLKDASDEASNQGSEASLKSSESGEVGMKIDDVKTELVVAAETQSPADDYGTDTEDSDKLVIDEHKAKEKPLKIKRSKSFSTSDGEDGSDVRLTPTPTKGKLDNTTSVNLISPKIVQTGTVAAGTGFRKHKGFTIDHPDEESDSSQHSNFGIHSSKSASQRYRTRVKGTNGEIEEKDHYCWQCHKEDPGIPCDLCPRVFHSKCIGVDVVPSSDWACPECQKMMQAECTDTQSRAMSMLSMEQFCVCLKYVVQRMKLSTVEAFHKPVDLQEIPNYKDYIINPMDLSTLERNIRKKMYGSTQAFIADAKWLLHNCIVFNGAGHKLTSGAKTIIKICKHETNEIEVCPDCYLNSCLKRNDNWFCEPCREPHTLVWAKLKGYPYWPAKALRVINGQVDVRFFGEHDRAWVPISYVYMLSKEAPQGMKKAKTDYDESMEELDTHIKKIIAKFGSFNYFPPRTLYSTVSTPEPGKPVLDSPVKSEGSSSPLSAVVQTTVQRVAKSPPSTEKPAKDAEKVVKVIHPKVEVPKEEITEGDGVDMYDETEEEVPMETDTKDDSGNVSPAELEKELSEANTPDMKVTRAFNTKEIIKRDIVSLQDRYSRTVVRVKMDKEATKSSGATDVAAGESDVSEEKSPSSPESDKQSQKSGVFTISDDAIDKKDRTINLTMPLLSTKFDVPKPRLPDKDVIKKIESVVKEKEEEEAESEVAENEADVENRSGDEDHSDTEGKTRRMSTNKSNPERLNNSTPPSPPAPKEQSVPTSLSSPEKQAISAELVAMDKAKEPSNKPASASSLTKKDNDFLEALVKTCQQKLAGKLKEANKNVAETMSSDSSSSSSSSSDTSDNEDTQEETVQDQPESEKEKVGAVEEKRTKSPDVKQPEVHADPSKEVSPPVNSITEEKKGDDLKSRADDVEEETSKEKAMECEEEAVNDNLEEKRKDESSSQPVPTASSSVSSSPPQVARREKPGPLCKKREAAAKRLLEEEAKKNKEEASESKRRKLSPAAKAKSVPDAEAATTTTSRDIVFDGIKKAPNIERYVKKAVGSLTGVFEEMCRDIIESQTENLLAQKLSQEIENLKWKHKQELDELKHNTELNIQEMKQFWKAGMETMRRQLLAEKKKAISETKKKQWCANCGKEAMFYCCWNTSYCDYPCQQTHWPDHMATCTQSQVGNNSSAEDETPAVSTVVESNVGKTRGSRSRNPSEGSNISKDNSIEEDPVIFEGIVSTSTPAQQNTTPAHSNTGKSSSAAQWNDQSRHLSQALLEKEKASRQLTSPQHLQHHFQGRHHIPPQMGQPLMQNRAMMQPSPIQRFVMMNNQVQRQQQQQQMQNSYRSPYQQGPLPMRNMGGHMAGSMGMGHRTSNSSINHPFMMNHHQIAAPSLQPHHQNHAIVISPQQQQQMMPFRHQNF